MIFLKRDECLSKTCFSYEYDAADLVFLVNYADGAVIERYRYDDFGAPTILTVDNTELKASAYGNRFLFTGRSYWPEFGLYDYLNRVYSTELGRFIQTDPIRFDAGDINIYRYCINNPLKYVDPFGLQTHSITLTASLGIPGWSVGFALDVSFDEQSGFDVTGTLGGGPSFPGANIALGYVPTNASSIQQLSGDATNISLGAYSGVGGEVQIVNGDGYMGAGLAIGVGTPGVEGSIQRETTFSIGGAVKVIFSMVVSWFGYNSNDE